jgi:peptide methionine sulfoxide reductase msrA/msrB
MKILITGIFIILIGLLIYTFNNNKPEAKPSTFMPSEKNMNNSTSTEGTKTMLVAGGCFWCVESDLEKLPGVRAAVSGYAGGQTENPTYENYGAGGHREVVEVTFDPSVVSFSEIAIYTIKHIDPTDGAGSFFDRGLSYAPALYFDTKEEKQQLESIIADIDENGPYDKPLELLVLERPKFWAAEDYHQDYYKGTLSGIKYQYYRKGSGRDAYIEKFWGTETGPNLPWESGIDEEEIAPEPVGTSTDTVSTASSWLNYQKPSAEILKGTMEALAYKVTQEDGTERADTSPLDKIYERGIFVDILSGEPLFSSRDKFDSGTGWPSFTAPIKPEAVTAHIDKKLFSTRTETRSAIADNHLGHVFPDGPQDRGGLRYCMNGVALRFVPEAEMVAGGYGDYLNTL